MAITRVYRKKAIKKRVVRKPKRTINLKAVRTMVKREIASNIENKQVRLNVTNRIGSWPPNYVNFANRNIIDTSVILRNIGQGSGQGQRIGNHIKLKNMSFQMTLFPAPSYTKPVMVKMWVVSDRWNPSQSGVQDIEDSLNNSLSQPGATFFENGNTTSGLLGNLFDLSMPVNKDRFRLFKVKTFKLGVNNLTGFHNNDYKLNFRYRLNLTKYMNKIVKYQDGLTGTWYNRKVFIIFSCVNPDDTSPGVATDTGSLSYTLEARYEDA